MFLTSQASGVRHHPHLAEPRDLRQNYTSV